MRRNAIHAYTLRLAGKSTEEIAEAMQMDKRRAMRLVRIGRRLSQRRGVSK
jgi:hypothetical protein